MAVPDSPAALTEPAPLPERPGAIAADTEAPTAHRPLSRPAETFAEDPGDQVARLNQVAFSSLYLWKACSDLSRPLPDCL